MNRKQEQLNEVKDAVDVFFMTLEEKVGIECSVCKIRTALEDFLFDQIEGTRADILNEMRERINGQIDEVERV